MSVSPETLWVSSTVMVAGFARGDVTGSMVLLASLLQHDAEIPVSVTADKALMSSMADMYAMTYIGYDVPHEGHHIAQRGAAGCHYPIEA